jgi:molybdenum cofactor cytidylyltransferase
LSGSALILAAGRGRRFGSDKRKARLPDGRTLLAATLERYASVFHQVRVVLRPGEALAEGCAARSIQILAAPRWADGMGATLAAGIPACVDDAWVFIGLGDMPWVRAETLRQLVAAFEEDPAQQRSIVQPVHAGRPGHPVGFRSVHFPALARLSGDQGARALVAAAPGRFALPVDDPGVLLDADTPEALDRALLAARTGRDPAGKD